MTEQSLRFKLLNVACRIMALWVLTVCFLAILVPIFGLIAGLLWAKNPEIIPYSLKMIAGFGVGIAISVVALKVRSFRPDLPRPRPDQSTNWWTGDLVERGGKVVA